MAIFKKRSFWNYFCQFGGLFLIGLFIFISYKDQTATIGGILTGVIIGTIIFTLSTVFMFFNFKAYLSIEDGRIMGKYHWFGKIDCDISDVAFALPQINTLSILLKNGKRHVIMGIENPWPLATEIRRQTFALESEDPGPLHKKLEFEQTARKKKLFWVLGGIAMMFVNIFIAVALTGGRDMYDFSKLDWILFASMGVLELATVVLTFYFAKQCGKYLLPIEYLKFRLKSAYIASQPLPSGNAKRIYTDENHVGRIIVYGFPNDESVYCCVQEFIGNFELKTTRISEIYASEDLLAENADFNIYFDITDCFQ